jgi:hypothetical protein
MFSGLLLIGATILAIAATPAWGSTFNVLSYGATGNGHTDDAPAVQRAEEAAELAGGGSVYMPAGKYLINSTILLGSNIEIYGDGDSTVLMRTDTQSMVPEYGADCQAAKPPKGPMTHLFTNRHYNCVDQNVNLHDFTADGSAIVKVPCGPLLAFSGLVDSTVANVTVLNAPQDAMFFRNGGVNLTVKNNKILFHDRLWGNGAGINVEMHVNGQIWGPVTITNNQIVTAATNFCSAALNRSCTGDLDCSDLQPSTCGKGASSSAGIAITWGAGSTHPPQATITGNHIWVGNDHYGIICNGCVNSVISGNVILSAKSRGAPGTGTFTGISSHSTAGGEIQNLTIQGNTIVGTGESEDGRAIFVNGQGSGSGLKIQDNVIAHKNSSNGKAVVEVRGLTDVNVSGNHLCFVSSNDIRVGGPEAPVVNGTMTKNTVVHIKEHPATLPAECSALPQ